MKKSFFIFLLFLGCQLVGGAALILVLNWDHLVDGKKLDVLASQHNPVATGIMMLVCNIVLILLLHLLRFIRRPVVPSSPRRPSLKGWGWALGAMLLLAFGLSLVLQPFHLSDGGSQSLFEGMYRNPLCLIGLCIVGPLAEELVFREGILRSLSLSGTAPWLALVVSAVLFGMLHANWSQSIPAIVAGLMLGIFFLGTGDVRLSVTAHIFNNTIGVLSILFPQLERATLSYPLWSQIAMGACSLFMSFTFLYIWWHKRSEYSFKEEMRAENPRVLY